jgi:pimeloyl-ACP methyl ester carboxylesterase
MPEIGPPRLLDTFLEVARCAHEYAAFLLGSGALKRSVPPGNGAPVLLIPGFAGTDGTTKPLRSFLNDIGYKAEPWNNGTNTGLDERTSLHLRKRLFELHKKHNRKISIVGHSLGGVFGRELAREYPHMVERVITLGSPFGAGAHPQSTLGSLRYIYNRINEGKQVQEYGYESLHDRILTPPPVPTTSVFTRQDGVVHWKTCINPRAPRAENVEIYASHIGIIANPLAALVVADRLAQDPENCQPFNAQKYNGRLFPDHKYHQEHLPALPNYKYAGKRRLF